MPESIPVFTCHDHMTITLWGEHYASLLWYNRYLDKCDYKPPDYIQKLFNSGVSTFGVSLAAIKDETSFLAWRPEPDSCINVDLDKVTQQVRNWVSENSIATLRLRHKRDRWSRRESRKMRVALGTCHTD